VLKQRIITGTLLALGAVLVIMLLPPHVLVVVLGLATLLACWEWSDLAGVQKSSVRIAYCVASACAIVGLLGLSRLFDEVRDLSSVCYVLSGAALWWCMALVWIKTYPNSTRVWASVGARLAMGWLTLLPAWLALAFLREQPDGEWKIIFLLGLVAAADIGAYFIGSNFGRHKLVPAVSPGKSWEGFWGGLVSSMVLSAVVWWLYWRAISLPAWLLVAAFTALASVLGDLLESMVKRYRGVKDSGNLLPGHGGVMDRLDSISAAAPIFALGLLLAK
jgi:phosphatidate cytidylyltransferase